MNILNKIKRKRDLLLWKAFGIQQIAFHPLNLVLDAVLGEYQGTTVFGIEFDSVCYWVTIYEDERSHEYDSPHIFKIENKKIGCLWFEKITRK